MPQSLVFTKSVFIYFYRNETTFTFYLTVVVLRLQSNRDFLVQKSKKERRGIKICSTFCQKSTSRQTGVTRTRVAAVVVPRARSVTISSPPGSLYPPSSRSLRWRDKIVGSHQVITSHQFAPLPPTFPMAQMAPEVLDRTASQASLHRIQEWRKNAAGQLHSLCTPRACSQQLKSL